MQIVAITAIGISFVYCLYLFVLVNESSIYM
jgi:hypothetical protein